jgi:hypothetical protein
MTDNLEQQIYEEFSELFEDKLEYGFECEDGWFTLINSLCCQIKDYLKVNHVKKPVRIKQIKQKFGGLRFYYNGGDECIFQMTKAAMDMSLHICEKCGSHEDVIQTQEGWVQTLCYNCIEIDDVVWLTKFINWHCEVRLHKNNTLCRNIIGVVIKEYFDNKKDIITGKFFNKYSEEQKDEWFGKSKS